jgi:RNA polymerase sigma-70 factor (ECF subfamily)
MGKRWVMVVRAERMPWAEAGEARRDEERELALRARTDRAAFGQLYDRYLTAIHGYCFRRLGSREAAEDATALVFTKALGAIGRFREDGPSFRAWLFAIAHNAVVDEVRARRWTTRFETEDGWEPAATGPGPEEVAVAAADLARLRALLNRLPPDQARMVELRLAGLTDREIAHVLGRSNGSVRIALHRALSQLRHLMNPEDRTDG